MKVRLQYFKQSGKYYTSDEYDSEQVYMFRVFEEVRAMLKDRRLPGLVDGHSNYIVYVEGVEGCDGSHPAIIMEPDAE